MGGEETLTKDDLVNMMDSYKSNIEFNKQLMTSQEILIDEQGKLIDKVIEVAKSQEVVARHMETMINTLTEHNAACNSGLVDASTSLKTVSEKIDTNKIEGIKEHSAMKIQMNVLTGGLILVIIALATALGKIWEKADIIDDVAKFIGM